MKSQHFSEPKFVCDTCHMKFRTSAKLKSHEKSHDDTKVDCPVCNKTFKSKAVLKVHKSTKHTHTQSVKPKKKWPCKLCPKVYESDRGLRSHVLNHKLAAAEETAEVNEVERETTLVEVETVAVQVEENETFVVEIEEELVDSSNIIYDEQVDYIVI